MNRFLLAFAGLAVAASSASAAFIGIQIREDKVLNLSASDAAIVDPLGLGVRAFNFYAKFNGAGTPFNSAVPTSVNDVLSIGQPDATTGFGINKADGANHSAYIFNLSEDDTPGPTPVDTGSYTAANNNLGLIRADTYFSVGRKIRGSGTLANSTSGDPDFAIVDTDGDGQLDQIRGGWFNANAPSRQGAAQSAGGKFETFIGQIVIVGLDPGANLYDDGLGGAEPNATDVWRGDIFKGGLTVFRQGLNPEPPSVGFRIEFAKPIVPTPGAIALFGIAGLAGSRRRR